MKRLSLSLILSLFAADCVGGFVSREAGIFKSLSLSGSRVFVWCTVGAGVVCFSILTLCLDRGKRDNQARFTGERWLLTVLIVASAVSYVVLELLPFPWRNTVAALGCFAIMVATACYLFFGTAEGRAELRQALRSVNRNPSIERLVCVALVVAGISTAAHSYFRTQVASVSMSEEALGFEDWQYILSGAPFKDLPFKVKPVSASVMTFYFAKGAGRIERVQEILSTLHHTKQATGAEPNN